MPKSQLGNQLLSFAMQMSFGHGVPTERVGEQLAIQPSVLFGSYHRIAKLFSEVPQKLQYPYRQAEVKHADETGWRT